MKEDIRIDVRRSLLGRVRGTGAAHSGVHHWYAEQVTSIALVPLTLWFIYSVVRLAGAPREAGSGASLGSAQEYGGYRRRLAPGCVPAALERGH